MRAIIVRPLGTKRDGGGEKIEVKRIGPMVKRFGMADRRTIGLLKPGNIGLICLSICSPSSFLPRIAEPLGFGAKKTIVPEPSTL